MEGLPRKVLLPHPTTTRARHPRGTVTSNMTSFFLDFVLGFLVTYQSEHQGLSEAAELVALNVKQTTPQSQHVAKPLQL